MAYSADGVSWTAVADSTFDTTDIGIIAFGNNRFVAGGPRGKIAYSSDGQSWTTAGEGILGTYTNFSGNRTMAEIIAVAYGNGRFVAGGNDGKMAYADW
jgi:hypothetical protein